MFLALDRRIWIGTVVCFVAGALARCAVGGETLTADQIVQNAVVRAEQTQSHSGQPGYTYTKLTVTEELDANGRVKERTERVYRVFFQRGSTLLKLLTVNGKPPSE